MAQACKATGGAGLSHSRGYEDAVNARISGEINGKLVCQANGNITKYCFQKWSQPFLTILRKELWVSLNLLWVRNIQSKMPLRKCKKKLCVRSKPFSKAKGSRLGLKRKTLWFAKNVCRVSSSLNLTAGLLQSMWTSLGMEMLSFLLEWDRRRWFVRILSWASCQILTWTDEQADGIINYEIIQKYFNYLCHFSPEFLV